MLGTELSTKRKDDRGSPEKKKTKLDEVHDDEYQKKLFTAAQSYTNKKSKQDLMDAIHKWNWKVRKGEKTGTIKANDIKGILIIKSKILRKNLGASQLAPPIEIARDQVTCDQCTETIQLIAPYRTCT